MAACRLGGATNVHISKLEFPNDKPCNLSETYGIISWARQTPPRFTSLVLLRRTSNPSTVRCSITSETGASNNLEDDVERKKPSAETRQAFPNASEVQYLLTEICDTTSIAEFELKRGGFRLYVTRDLAQNVSSPPPRSAPVITNMPVETPDSNGLVSTHSLAISKYSSSLGQKQTLQEQATDEGLFILKSPKVGYFRTSGTRKGVRGPPVCKENKIVNEGQLVCFIEQLGVQSPVTTAVSGEIIKILRADGDPVGYGDALLTILPSFPGIKKLL